MCVGVCKCANVPWSLLSVLDATAEAAATTETGGRGPSQKDRAGVREGLLVSLLAGVTVAGVTACWCHCLLVSLFAGVTVAGVTAHCLSAREKELREHMKQAEGTHRTDKQPHRWHARTLLPCTYDLTALPHPFSLPYQSPMPLSATPGASPTRDGHQHAAAAANSLKDTIGCRGLQLSLRW